MKKVLVVYYTQTGQQKEILDRILSQLQKDPGVELTYHKIQPVRDFPFPWDSTSFFDAFPESFLQIPCELNPLPQEIINRNFDLVILGYQVWYLSPSIPVNSFLKSAEGKNILSGRPVITISGSRNMWVMAQEKVKRLLKDCGAELVGNIALVDRNFNHVSLITIVHWMMKGKKDSYLGIFPKPGVSDKDIRESEKFGPPILQHLKENNYEGLQPELVRLEGVIIKPLLVFIDKTGNRIFSKWSAIIRKKGLPGDPKRRPWLKAFYIYLWIALWFIAPIVTILFLILSLPFFLKLKKETKYYQSVKLK